MLKYLNFKSFDFHQFLSTQFKNSLCSRKKNCKKTWNAISKGNKKCCWFLFLDRINIKNIKIENNYNKKDHCATLSSLVFQLTQI